DRACPAVLESRYCDLLHVETWRSPHIDHTLIADPPKHSQRGNGHGDLGDTDEFRRLDLHAVLENRSDKVSESFVTLPAPITTTASPGLALAIMKDSIASKSGAYIAFLWPKLLSFS